MVFGNDYQWKIAKEPLDNSQGQIDTISIVDKAGFGPRLSFAKELKKQKKNIK